MRAVLPDFLSGEIVVNADGSVRIAFAQNAAGDGNACFVAVHFKTLVQHSAARVVGVDRIFLAFECGTRAKQGNDSQKRKQENDVAIVRVEQLYPFPYDEVRAELAKYPNAKSVVWAQEEPKNQGAFYQIRHRLEDVIGESQKLSYAGRPSSASPAVGYMSKHVAQLKQLVEDAMTL